MLAFLKLMSFSGFEAIQMLTDKSETAPNLEDAHRRRQNDWKKDGRKQAIKPRRLEGKSSRV